MCIRDRDLAKQIDLVKPAFDGGFTSELTLAYENIARDYMLLGDLNGCIDFTFNESNKVDASKLTKAVSYTHLDVYKRQMLDFLKKPMKEKVIHF